jgi:WD40 repeat protein
LGSREKLPVYERSLSRKALDGIASGKHFLALSSRDGSVRVFATDDLAHERWKFQNLHAAYCVALSPDETLVAAGFDDGQAQVWSTETGAKVLPPLKHTRGITSICFSPDGMLLLTTSFEGYAKVWSTASGLQETTALPQAGHVRAARFAPDGRRVVVAGFDGSIRLWDLGGIMSPQKIPRGSTLLNDGVWASSVAQPPALALSSEHGLVTLPVPGEIKAIETSLNRNLLLAVTKSASDTWTIRGLAENSSQFLPWVIERKGSQPVITPGAETFTMVMGRRVESFSWMEGSPVGLLNSPDDAVTCATPPDSGWGSICTGTNVILFRGSSRLILDHDLKTSRAVMSPDGSRVVTCTLTKGLHPCYAQVWKVPSGEPVSPRLRHSDGVQDAAWSKDGRLLVTVDEDGIGIIWNTASWVPVGRSLRHSDQILSVKIGGSPEMIATASADRTVRLWDLQTGLPLTPPLSMTFDVSAVSFLKDGLLATELEGDDWLWKLPSSGSLTDPQRGKIALLMNGLDRTALDSAETVDRWETLRSTRPEQTEASNEEISRWHQIQADTALVNRKHHLEEHHMRKVVEFYPKAYGASNQLANAVRRARRSE